MKIDNYIIFTFIISLVGLYYGVRSLEKFNDKYDKMDDDRKFLNYDIKIDILGIIIISILGIIGSILFAFD